MAMIARKSRRCFPIARLMAVGGPVWISPGAGAALTPGGGASARELRSGGCWVSHGTFGRNAGISAGAGLIPRTGCVLNHSRSPIG